MRVIIYIYLKTTLETYNGHRFFLKPARNQWTMPIIILQHGCNTRLLCWAISETSWQFLNQNERCNDEGTWPAITEYFNIRKKELVNHNSEPPFHDTMSNDDIHDFSWWNGASVWNKNRKPTWSVCVLDQLTQRKDIGIMAVWIIYWLKSNAYTLITLAQNIKLRITGA